MRMSERGARGILAGLTLSLVVGCGARAKLSVLEGTGANPARR